MASQFFYELALPPRHCKHLCWSSRYTNSNTEIKQHEKTKIVHLWKIQIKGNEIDMEELPDKEFKRMIMAMVKQLKEDRNKKINEIRKPSQDMKIKYEF